MEIKITKNKSLDTQALSAKAKKFLSGKSQWALVALAVAGLVYCAYLWYIYVANPQWSDSQKQSYISGKQSAVVFDQKKFDAIVSEIGRRKNEYSQAQNAPDIFRLK